ncbi:MAG TPA: polyprenyl synthetase family protein [Jatrophihabitantaceae bacterium]
MIDLGAVIQRVDAELARFFDGRRARLTELGDDLAPLTDTAREFVLDGGKRLRPMFAYCGWRSVRSTEGDEPMVTAAASLELLHGCALIHDDVMDGSSTRRGRPSVHAAFTEIHRAGAFTGDPRVFGTAAAIVVGDLLLTWADAMFAGAGFAEADGRRARIIYDDMRQQVMAGQYLDMLVQTRGDFSVNDALRVARYKTSKYTIEGPLQFGAAAAGAPAEVVEAISGYGLPLGEAFQLRDDVLGVFGDPGRTGKPIGDDLREGKRTMLVALAMQAATPDQASLLRAGLGNRDLDDTGAAALCEVIVATGALDRVEARIAERADQARAALTPAIGADARDVLDSLAVLATERHT